MESAQFPPKMKVQNAVASQYVRLKHSPLLWFHFAAGVLSAALSGLYFSVSPWNTALGADAYVQFIGALLPLTVCTIMAFDIDIERNSGELSTVLAVPSRSIQILGKIIAYALLAAVTIAISIFGFALALISTGKNQLPFITYVSAVFFLWLGCIVLYVFATWSALSFGRNVTIGIGTILTIVAISSLGGLAHGLVSGELTAAHSPAILTIMPMSWSTQMGSLAIESSINPAINNLSMTSPSLLIYGVIASATAIISISIVCVCINGFENRRRAS